MHAFPERRKMPEEHPQCDEQVKCPGNKPKCVCESPSVSDMSYFQEEHELCRMF
jgi:hypothetical protein